MEILIVVAVWSVIVKRGVEDIIHTAKGGTPPRYAAARARRQSGAAGRYWGQMWDDTWEDMARKHSERRARRRDSAPASSSRPRGAATQFFAGLAQDGRRAVRRSWDHGWSRLDERRREKATRPRPGQQTVPGEVVPNAQDDNRPQDGGDFTCLSCGKAPALPGKLWCSSCTPSRPQDEDRPGPEPHLVPTEDGTDLQFGDDPTDPTGTKQCPECHGTVLVDGEVCLSCRDRQEQRNQHHETQDSTGRCSRCGDVALVDPAPGHPPYNVCLNCWKKENGYPPDSGPEQDFAPPLDPTTQEGTTTMTTTIPADAEVIGLDPAIDYCGTTVQACKAMVHSLERTEAAIIAGGVTGVASAAFAQARDLFDQIAVVMKGAGDEFVAHKAGQEFYDANPGAGTKEFLTAGR